MNEALAVTQTLGDPEALGADLNLWGILEITEGRTEDAISLLRRSYELREEALGPEHPDTIESLNNLAVAYWRVGAEDEAIGSTRTRSAVASARSARITGGLPRRSTRSR